MIQTSSDMTEPLLPSPQKRRCIALMDAGLMAEEHPEAFDTPDTGLLEVIKPGDCVKVCDGRERFWVLVTEVRGDTLLGTINNHLAGVVGHGLTYPDEIRFRRTNIYQVNLR